MVEIPSKGRLSAEGSAATLLVRLSESGGWDVKAELNGRALESTHCSDWHRVERELTRLTVKMGTTEIKKIDN